VTIFDDESEKAEKQPILLPLCLRSGDDSKRLFDFNRLWFPNGATLGAFCDQRKCQAQGCEGE
jgi:hypothetical protein